MPTTDYAVFGFVRNPWVWYVSWYNFHLHGSDVVPPRSEAFRATFRNQVAFEDILRKYCTGDADTKKRMANATCYAEPQFLQVSHYRFAFSWLDHDVSFFEHLYDSYLGSAEHVGKHENLRGDLLDIAKRMGFWSPEVEHDIANTPPIQVGKKVDYRTYYTDETAQLVADTHKRIIDLYGYTFEG